MPVAVLVFFSVSIALAMLGSVMRYRDRRLSPDKVRGFIVTLGRFKTLVADRGLVLNYDSPRALMLERGALLSILSAPIAVAGFIVGFTQW